MVEKVHKEGSQSMQDLNYFLTELKEQNPWLYQHHSKMLQMVSTQVAGAQKAIRELHKKGRKTGGLHFALYNKYNTFVYNQSGFKMEKGFLHLSKIGKIPIVQHRTIPEYCTVRQVTISRQAGKWFVCITYDSNDIMAIPWWNLQKGKKAIGIDVGIKNFAYDSDNDTIPNPLFLKTMLKPLARAQRKISRRKKGSQNRKKAIQWCQKVHKKIANRRKDFCHKASNVYAKKHCTVFLEDLQIPNMVRNHKLSRNILDSGWGTFKKYLQYKTDVRLAPSHNTSVDCSRCGGQVPKSLAVRTHRCSACGLVLDRDHNAALNILKKGLEKYNETVPQELRELTPVEISNIVAYGNRRSLKQEEATVLVR